MTEKLLHEWLRNPETDGYFLCPVAVVEVYLNGGWERSGEDPALAARRETMEAEHAAEEEKARTRREEREAEERAYHDRLNADPVASLLKTMMYHCVDCMGEDGEPSYDDWPFEVSKMIRELP